jgi:signal transduction histidine kinase
MTQVPGFPGGTLARRRQEALLSRWQELRGRRWVKVAAEVVLLVLAAVDAIPPWSGPPAWDRDWIVSALAVAGLLVRRRYSLVSWLLCLPGIVWSDVLVAPLIAVFSVADRNRRLWVVAIVVAGSFAAQVVGAQVEGFVGPGLAFLQTLVFAAVFATGPAALGLLMGTRRQLTAQLRQLTETRQSERILLVGSVRAEERTRLAREMHDVVSHQVSLIALQAGALRVTADSPATREIAATIRVLAARTLDELRVMIGVLRGGQESELAPQPRLADIPQLVADSGLPASLDSDLPSDRNWPAAVQRAAYRSVQEGLTNARKHAPGALITVRLLARGPLLLVQVHNDPPPGSPVPAAGAVTALPDGGHGLVGLRERAELLGGQLRAAHTDSGGFDLLVTLGSPTYDGQGTLR